MTAAAPPMPAPENYIVRIYRREPHHGNRIAGTVEIVGAGTERSFRNLRELRQILCAPAERTGAPSEGEIR
ncbi:MAG TPA: hypothetical protein VFA35_05435 [Burkholderiaceae bacterium]|nr:hypothetical protein [Burkholderiaceae bacterium]